MAVDYGKLGELIDGYGGIAADDLNALQEVRDTRDDEITRLRDENCRLREALAEIRCALRHMLSAPIFAIDPIR